MENFKFKLSDSVLKLSNDDGQGVVFEARVIDSDCIVSYKDENNKLVEVYYSSDDVKFALNKGLWIKLEDESVMNDYKIEHSYSRDTELRSVYFKSQLTSDELIKSVAHIQFLVDDVTNGEELTELDTVILLKMYYDSDLEIVNFIERPAVLDLYENWEYNAGNCYKIMNDEYLKRKGMDVVITMMLKRDDYLLSL